MNYADLLIVLGFRNWHLDHLDRCLESLRRQTRGLIAVVDLGSRETVLDGVRATVVRHKACVIPHPAPEWSRSLALNVGATDWRGDWSWFVFTDADMIFPTSWFPAVRAELDAGWGGLLLTPSRDLPEGWEGLDGFDWRDDRALERMTTSHPPDGQGAGMVVPRAWFERVGGFDEFYTVWGSDDNDLVDRAEWAGLRSRWVDTFVGHQWHRRDWPTPEQYARVQANRVYYAERKAAGGPIVRNLDGARVLAHGVTS